MDIEMADTVAGPLRFAHGNVDIQYFTASGTWHKPAKAVRVDYLLCGGGGSGSVGVGHIGTDGEDGALRAGSVPASGLPDEIRVEVGAGGRGATGSSGVGGGENGNGCGPISVPVRQPSGEMTGHVFQRGHVQPPRLACVCIVPPVGQVPYPAEPCGRGAGNVGVNVGM